MADALRLRLDAALIGERGLIGPDHLAHDLARKSEPLADFPNGLSVNEECTADLGDRVHNQHPYLGSQNSAGSTVDDRLGRGPFWKPIRPETGSLLRAYPHLMRFEDLYAAQPKRTPLGNSRDDLRDRLERLAA